MFRWLTLRLGKKPKQTYAESELALPSSTQLPASEPPLPVARIFQAGAYPENTFIDRDIPEVHLLRSQLESGGKIICVSGPSKVGKTVLCRRLLKDGEFIRIPGSRIKTYDEFVGAIADALGIASETIRRSGRSDQQQNARSDTIEGGIAMPILSADASISKSEQETQQVDVSTEEVVRGSLENRLFRSLEERRICLMIDDFHSIPQDEQTRIISSCKDYLVAGEFRLLLVAIPSQMFETMRGKPEMVGRILHIKIPAWQTDELERIAYRGFELLGWKVDKAEIRRLAVSAYGNPLLLQEMCQTFVNEARIHHNNDPSKVTSDAVLKRLVESYEWMGAACDYATAEKKWSLIQSRSASNKKVSTAELALLAASEFPWNHVLSVKDTIIPRMKVLSGTSEEIRSMHVLSALRAVSNALTPDPVANPYFEIESSDRYPVKIIFREPNFRFFLLWGLRQKFKMRTRSEQVASTGNDEHSGKG